MPVSAINANVASQKVFGQAQKINSRITPSIEGYKLREMEEGEVHVFSVCIWAHPIPMGNWGTFIIPAKKANEPYAEFLATFPFYKDTPTAVPGVLLTPRIISGEENVWHEEDGREWAEKLVMDYTKYGVFVAAGAVPSKEELFQATMRFREACGFYVEQARELAADPFKRREIQITPHHEAAAELGLDEPWTKANEAKDTQKCPLCGRNSEVGVLLCANGHDPYIFDVAGYQKVMASQAAALKKGA